MAPRRAVFISYSHGDTAWRDRLADHLKALSIDGRLDLWSDERIRTGADWRTEIQTALRSASAAVLVVTRRFLSSPFIVKEEIAALLQRRQRDGLPIYAVIVEPCVWRKFPWLEAMQVVRIADHDKVQPTDYEIDQCLVRLVTEIDDALGEQAKPGTREQTDADSDEPRAPLSRDDRRRQIEQLLEQVAEEDSMDGLPKGLLKLIDDVSCIPLLEAKLDPKATPIAMMNAIKAIRLSADWEWDHKEFKSPESSLPKLTALYEQVGDVRVRSEILSTIMKFSPPEIPFEFLMDHLATDAPVLKATILADMQFLLDRPYLEEMVQNRLLPLLEEFCRYPQAKCIYSDQWQGEMDFRFWVFRCLGGIRSPSSAKVIEDFIESNRWPLDTLAEAADAHWAITRTPKYVDVLRKAEQEGALGNAEGALREMEKFLGVRRQKAKRANGTPAPRTGRSDRSKSRTRPARAKTSSKKKPRRG